MPIPGCKVRGLLLLLLCAFLISTGAYLYAQDQIKSRNIEIEHRVTALEVEVMGIVDDIKSIKTIGGAALIGIVGLLGERGANLFFRKGE